VTLGDRRIDVAFPHDVGLPRASALLASNELRGVASRKMVRASSWNDRG